MATAAGYDEWDDPGLAFSEDEIKGYVPSAVATKRIDALVAESRVLARVVQLNVAPLSFWQKAHPKVLDVATWYAMACNVPGIDREAITASLPPLDTKEGKALTVEARKLDAAEWLADYGQQARSLMTYVVTIGRRCATAKHISGWGKRERSLSNKLANAVHKEITLAQKLTELLISVSK